jgi:hypothetical protein
MTYLDRIEQIQQTITFSRAIGYIVSTPFYLIGWTLGKLWWLVSIWIGATVAGFQDGSGRNVVS